MATERFRARRRAHRRGRNTSRAVLDLDRWCCLVGLSCNTIASLCQTIIITCGRSMRTTGRLTSIRCGLVRGRLRRLGVGDSMAALVKGLSGSATFRLRAGSWVMRGRITGGGRRCRMLGRRLSLKHGSCAVRDRTLEDWLDALRVKTAKAKAGIPCPLCGGRDRFHVQRGTRGQAVIGGCRQCSKPLYPDIARAVFGDSEHDSRRPVARPTPMPRTTSFSRPSGLAAAQRAYARRCWEAAEWTPTAPSHRGRRCGGVSFRRRPWCAISQHSPRLDTRWTAGSRGYPKARP